MSFIRVGTDRWGNPVYYFENGKYGVVAIVAKPRYGKSVLTKNWYVQIAQGRPMIVFDYQGEHTDVRWGNWLSPNVSFVPNMLVVENFAFYVMDFQNPNDWVSMGFTSPAANLIYSLLPLVNIHHNDPYVFYELLNALPTKTDDIAEFNARFSKYGLKFDVRIPDGTKISMIHHMASVLNSGLLMAPVGSDNWEAHSYGRMHIDDWGQLIRDNEHIVINMNMMTKGSETMSQTMVGKILAEILPTIRTMSYPKPLILFEEADLLAPADANEAITSLEMMRWYVLKEQRTGVKMAFITQNPGMMAFDVIGAANTWIMGHHTPSFASQNALDTPHSSYDEIIKSLKYDMRDGTREFAIMEAGDSGRFKIFQPDQSVTELAMKMPYEYHQKKFPFQYSARGRRIMGKRKEMVNYG